MPVLILEKLEGIKMIMLRMKSLLYSHDSNIKK